VLLHKGTGIFKSGNYSLHFDAVHLL